MSALQELWFSFFSPPVLDVSGCLTALVGDVFPFSGCNEQTNNMTSLLMPVNKKVFTLQEGRYLWHFVVIFLKLP